MYAALQTRVSASAAVWGWHGKFVEFLIMKILYRLICELSFRKRLLRTGLASGEGQSRFLFSFIAIRKRYVSFSRTWLS